MVWTFSSRTSDGKEDQKWIASVNPDLCSKMALPTAVQEAEPEISKREITIIAIMPDHSLILKMKPLCGQELTTVKHLGKLWLQQMRRGPTLWILIQVRFVGTDNIWCLYLCLRKTSTLLQNWNYPHNASGRAQLRQDQRRELQSWLQKDCVNEESWKGHVCNQLNLH